MSKLAILFLLLGTACVLLSQQTVEGRPFFFKYIDLTTRAPTTAEQAVRKEVHVTSNVSFCDIIVAKLRLLLQFFQFGGTVSGGFGIHVNPNRPENTTTSTSKPVSTTQVDLVFRPESVGTDYRPSTIEPWLGSSSDVPKEQATNTIYVEVPTTLRVPESSSSTTENILINTI